MLEGEFWGAAQSQTPPSYSYGVVYVFSNQINNKCYVGQTTAKNPQKYCQSHVKAANLGNQTLQFYSGIRKHGSRNFDCKIVYYAFDKEALNDAEAALVLEFNSLTPNGYNIKPGGGAQGKQTEEIKAKISLVMQGIYRKNQELKKGLGGLSGDQQRTIAKKGGVRTAELGTGGYQQMSREQRVKNGLKAGHNSLRLRLGFHNLTVEQQQANRSKGGSTASANRRAKLFQRALLSAKINARLQGL